MSYPVILEGPPGEHWNIYGTTSQRWPLGTKLLHQDGRSFRFVQNGGVAMVRGAVQQAAANAANHINVVQTAGTPAAVGARSIGIDIVTATDITLNMYKEGFFNVSDGVGEGYIYKIASHDTNTAEDTTSTVFNFVPGDTIQVATTAATDVSLIKNPYDEVVIFPTTASGSLVGVGLNPVVISGHGWVQTRGLASVLTNGTLLIGEAVHTGITTAGAVTALSTTFDEPYGTIVGFVQHVAASTEFSTIFLTIDG